MFGLACPALATERTPQRRLDAQRTTQRRFYPERTTERRKDQLQPVLSTLSGPLADIRRSKLDDLVRAPSRRLVRLIAFDDERCT